MTDRTYIVVSFEGTDGKTQQKRQWSWTIDEKDADAAIERALQFWKTGGCEVTFVKEPK